MSTLRGGFVGVVLFLSFGLGSAHGAGFTLGDTQDPVTYGTAGAGAAALGEDPSTIFANPAALTRLEGFQASFHLTTVSFDANFHDNGSNTAGILPISGSEGGNAGVPGAHFVGRLVPSAYFSFPLAEPFGKPVFLGLGVNAPFALETDYDPASLVRYHATNTRLLTLNLNPSLAIKLAPWLSWGVGFDAEYAEVALSRAIDFGLAGFSLGIPGFAPGLNDGTIHLGANDIGFGWNTGLLLEPTAHTRIGFHYRSNVELHFEGDADFRNVPAPFNGTFFDQKFSADLNLPASYSLSGYQELGSGFAVVGDVTYTQWSSFDKIAIDFKSGVTPPSVQFQSYRDVFRFSGGVIYTVPGNRWTLRAGYGYDQSPIRNAELRTPRVPDNDRQLVAAGITYRPTAALDLNLAYAHYFLADAAINNDDGAGHLLRGAFEVSGDIVTVGVTYRFGRAKTSVPEVAGDKSYRK